MLQEEAEDGTLARWDTSHAKWRAVRCTWRHSGRYRAPPGTVARRRPGRQRSHPSGAGPADEVTRLTEFSARTLRPPSAPVHGTLFVPAMAEPSAAVLLIGGSDGGEPSRMGEALAGEGVAALSVAYFARPGLPGKLRSIPLEYFFAALQTLQNELPSPGTPLAVLGISRGSEAAMLTAIHSPVHVRGVIAAVPGNVVLSGWPPGWPARRPAWLLDGRPLPYVNHFGPRCRDPDALIPVELVPGPILLVAAGADRVWPSAAMARALSGRLRQHGASHGHTILEYPEAGHRLGGLLPQPPPGLLPQDTADEAATWAGGPRRRVAKGHRVHPATANTTVTNEGVTRMARRSRIRGRWSRLSAGWRGR
jgi:dienelactone hydrolase